jgi:hypothetical protein
MRDGWQRPSWAAAVVIGARGDAFRCWRPTAEARGRTASAADLRYAGPTGTGKYRRDRIDDAVSVRTRRSGGTARAARAASTPTVDGAPGPEPVSDPEAPPAAPAGATEDDGEPGVGRDDEAGALEPSGVVTFQEAAVALVTTSRGSGDGRATAQPAVGTTEV